jgi:hypothetical protein
MGKINGRWESSDSLRQQLADLDASIKELRDELRLIEGRIKALLLPAHYDTDNAREELKSVKGKRSRAQLELKGKEELRPALAEKLAEVLAAEADVAMKSKAEEALDIAEALVESGRQLNAHLSGTLSALRDIRDDLNRSRHLLGSGLSGEQIDVGLKDLIRSVFSSMPELGVPYPNRRWTAIGLVGLWSTGVRGRAQKAMDAPPSEPKPEAAKKLNGSAKPKPSQVDVGMDLPGDHGDLLRDQIGLGEIGFEVRDPGKQS